MFGKPEDYGITFNEPPTKRRVHLTGHVTIEFSVDEWLDADEDDSDEDLKRDAIDAAGFSYSGNVDYEHVSLTVEDEGRIYRQKQAAIERKRLADWNSGAPIAA